MYLSNGAGYPRPTDEPQLQLAPRVRVTPAGATLGLLRMERSEANRLGSLRLAFSDTTDHAELLEGRGLRGEG